MKTRKIPTIKRETARVLTLVTLAALLTQVMGCCTLIGLGVGAAIDRAKPSGFVAREQWSALPLDAHVEVLERNGSEVAGRFIGMESIRPDSAIVTVRTDSIDTSMPASRIASICRCGSSDGKIVGLFAGFVVDCVVTVAVIHALEDENWVFGSGSWGKTTR